LKLIKYSLFALATALINLVSAYAVGGVFTNLIFNVKSLKHDI